MPDWSSLVLAAGKCCACEDPLRNSKHLNMVNLDKFATWTFPVWGNILAKKKEHQGINRAVAIVCDSCVDQKSGKLITPIKYAIEVETIAGSPDLLVTEPIIRYHDVKKLKDAPLITEKDLRVA